MPDLISFADLGTLTQLVQSVTSTTWKSLVRIQYVPQKKSGTDFSVSLFNFRAVNIKLTLRPFKIPDIGYLHHRFLLVHLRCEQSHG